MTVPNGPLLGLSDPNGLYYIVQQDGDDDGYGNACDCDYNNDGGCGLDDAAHFLDLISVRSPVAAELDINSDGAPGLDDFVITRPHWGGPLRPSGLACSVANEKGSCPPEWP